MTERFYTAAEVADMLGFSADTILDWHEAGKLPGYRFGKKGARVRFRECDIATLVDKCATFTPGQLPEMR